MEMGKETEMREKELYTKICPECNETFRTDKGWAKRCHTCEMKEKIAPAPPKIKRRKPHRRMIFRSGSFAAHWSGTTTATVPATLTGR